MSLLRKIYLVVALILVSGVSLAQEYYVVIKSFDSERNARVYVGYARSNSYEASYTLNPANNRYYIYILRTEDRKAAVDLAKRMQSETEFKDAWVFIDKSHSLVHQEKVPSEPDKDQPSQAVVIVEPAEAAKDKLTQTELNKPDDHPVEAEVEAQDNDTPQQWPAETEIDPKTTKPRGKYFMFMAKTKDGRQVAGNIFNVDKLLHRDLATYKANKVIDILRPYNSTLNLACEIFGYSHLVKVIDYNDPAKTSGVFHDEDGVWVVSFQLEPLKAGDVSMMYNVSFYRDAVIMLPQSKSDLDELVYMMTSNPRRKIKIHAHTNGKEKDIRIVTRGAVGDYFSIEKATGRLGSHKELSQLRAEAIRSYLVEHGANRNMIEVYAWGGSEIWVNRNSAAATRVNNRIEIEILQD